MTDITELAPTMKAAAEPISSGYSRNWIVSHDDETCWVGANDDDGNLTPFIEVSIADWSGNKADNEKLARFIALCRPANVLALVEALEKAQTTISEMDDRIRKQNRHVCELFDDNAALRQRIAELESHKAALLKFIRDSCYVFDGADEDISDAYVDAITSGLMPKLETVAACTPPLFWVRVKSDGGYDGPVHDSQLEEVRKKSGEWLPLTLALRVPGLESRTVTPVTYSENADADYCRKWAWEQVKGEISTEGWTTGDNINYFGFFCWGWDMRRQYNEQRPVTVKLPEASYPDGDIDCPLVVNVDDVKDVLTAAGIKVETE